MNDERKTSFEDELLDRALEHQRVEEPRPGLEGRVLARLETALAPRGNWFLRACAIAVPAALLVTVAVYLFRPPVTPPTIAPEPPRIVEQTPPAATVPELLDPIPAPPIVKEEIPIVPPTVETASSRSPTFPAQDGLSPQEALLVRFVRSTRKETLHAVAKNLPSGPLQIDELSTTQIQVEPLPAADPLSAS
jgi:hypothetical protein